MVGLLVNRPAACLDRLVDFHGLHRSASAIAFARACIAEEVEFVVSLLYVILSSHL